MSPKLRLGHVADTDCGCTDALVSVGPAGAGGTGSFVSSSGLILTNHHVALEAIRRASTSTQVTLPRGIGRVARDSQSCKFGAPVAAGLSQGRVRRAEPRGGAGRVGLRGAPCRITMHNAADIVQQRRFGSPSAPRTSPSGSALPYLPHVPRRNAMPRWIYVRGYHGPW